MDDFGLILALIDGISADNAKKLGAIGISYIDTNPTGTGFIFYMADNTTVDVPLSMDFLFTKKYDPNKDGSVVKSDTLQLKDGSTTFHTGEQLLNRDNHTGTQKADTITVNKTGFNEFLKDFQGQNLQELCTYLNSHKEFIQGLMIGDSTKDGSFRIQNNNSRLEYQRLENGTYKTIGTVGYSSTDRLELNASYSSIDFKNGSNTLNLARITTDGKSEQLGDPRLERLVLSGQQINKQNIENTFTSHEYMVNNDTSLTQNVTTWEFNINVVPTDKYNRYAIYAVDTNNTTLGYYKYTITDVLTGNVVVYTNSDFELKQGLTNQFTTTGLHTETLPKLLHLTCGRNYKITFTAQTSIGFKGGLVSGSFKPYCNIKYYFIEENELLSKQSVTDSVSSNNSTTVASSKAVYTLAQAINSISGGMSPIIPISCEDFSALKSGTNGSHYILTNDGSILGKNSHQYDNIFMINTFGETVATERAIEEDDFVLVSSNATPDGSVYITNVLTLTDGKSVMKTMNDYPNEGSVKSASSDDNSYRVLVEWDRGSSEFCGQPNVNGKDVIGIEKLAGSYTGYVNIASTDIIDDKIVATLGKTTYTIAFKIISPPIINSITFGSLPNGQTELKEGDIIPVTIVTDKAIDRIEFQDSGAFQYQMLTVSPDTAMIVTGYIANRGDILQNLTGSIRVRSTEGSWSSITSSIETLPLNNLKPTITLNSKTFSSGFSALKNSETCDITVSSINCDTLTSSAIGTDLNVGTMIGNSCVVTRINNDYNDNISNLRIEGTRNANGATRYLDVCVEIVNVAPLLTNSSNIPKIRTGENNPVMCQFNQKIKVDACTIVTLNKGTLTTGTLPTILYSNSYSPNISVLHTDDHSNNNLTMTLSIVGMSGIPSVVFKYYVICGFTQETIVATYPNVTASIPTITNMSNLILSGIINTNPPYNICTTYASPPTIITDYSISGNTLTLPPLSVLGGFYYSANNSIIITIEETV